MRVALIAAVAACAASSAIADYVAPVDGGYVRLENSPCSDRVVLDLLRDEFKPLFKKGYMVFHGRQIALCWLPEGSDVVVIDAEGDGGRLSMSLFKKVSGV